MRKAALLWSLCLVALAAWSATGEVKFKKIVVDKTFRSEGVAVGDVNKDGKLDILAGDVWYEAPDWKMHELRKVGKYDGNTGYSQCFQNFAQDVNGDGWIDSIVVNFPGSKCVWYENPQGKEGPWKERLVSPSCCGETVLFADLLGDGKKVLIFGVQPEGVVAWFSIPKDLDAPRWDVHPISDPKSGSAAQYAHGYGCGDINGDGRNDFLVTGGWWEAPEDRTKGPWTFHPAKLGPACADMIVYDVDGDGDADVITSSAHDYGMWWLEQVKTDKGIEFKQHEIYGKPKAEPYPEGAFRPFSEPHALILVDINGDGLKDLATGKRWYAHQGGDPGGKEPAVLYWFELRRPEKGKVEFIPHKMDDDSGVGTQFEIADMNGDGKPDCVLSNKKGVNLFIQE
jgi:hypothetical protein